MRRLLPAHSKDVRYSEIGNLDMTFRVEEEVLRLDISMRDSHRMEVRDSAEDLLKVRVDLSGGHVAFLDRGVEISSGTVLHHLAPVRLLILNEIDRFHDVLAAKAWNQPRILKCTMSERTDGA